MARQPRIVWFQNNNDHYFVRMIDALNARGDAVYFPVFLCPPPGAAARATEGTQERGGPETRAGGKRGCTGGNGRATEGKAGNGTSGCACYGGPVPKGPHAFLGRPGRPGRLRADARAYVRGLGCDVVILGGYNSLFKLWVMRHCCRRGIPCCLFADSNIRSERGESFLPRLAPAAHENGPLALRRPAQRRRFAPRSSFSGPINAPPEPGAAPPRLHRPSPAFPRPTSLQSLKRLAKKLFLPRVIARLTRIIPVNRCGVAYWRYYGSPRDKIRRSTYFCRLDLLDEARSRSREETLARHGLPADGKLIFTAARLVPVKGLDLMLTAFQQARLTERGWVWAIAGDGQLRNQLVTLTRSDAGRSIRFLGHQAPTEIMALMLQSNLFILPSWYEPHGIVVTEALAAGTPVIASDVGGAAVDLVQPYRTGWLFRNGDAADLQRVLIEATADPARLAAMRPACTATFQRWYAQYAPTKVIPELIRELCRGAPNRCSISPL